MELPEVITIRFLKSEKTGLLAAITDDIPGFTITGRTIEAIEAKLAEAVAEVLQEQFGVSVEVTKEDRSEPEGFVPLSSIPDWRRMRVKSPDLRAA